MAKRRQFPRYTVVWFFDGDSGVDTYVTHVTSPNKGDAFERAVEKEIREGGMDGDSASDLRNGGTEIITFPGYLESVYAVR